MYFQYKNPRKITAICLFLTSITFFVPVSVLAGLFGPSDYDECILDSMKGVTSDKAALLIRRACGNKFADEPEPEPESRTLTPQELKNITGRAGLGYSNYFSGDLYNANTNLTISEVTIRDSTIIGGRGVMKIYTATGLNIQSQATGSFGFSIIVGDTGSDYSWNLESAKGY